METVSHILVLLKINNTSQKKQTLDEGRSIAPDGVSEAKSSAADGSWIFFTTCCQFTASFLMPILMDGSYQRRANK